MKGYRLEQWHRDYGKYNDHGSRKSNLSCDEGVTHSRPSVTYRLQEASVKVLDDGGRKNLPVTFAMIGRVYLRAVSVAHAVVLSLHAFAASDRGVRLVAYIH